MNLSFPNNYTFLYLMKSLFLFFFLKNVKLSAEVEPFIPQKKGPETLMIPMALPNDSGGINGVEPTPIPSYLITCYPFVQENQSNR